MSWSTCRRVDWLYRHHWSAAINSTKQHETGSVITRYITCRCYEKEVPAELAIHQRHGIPPFTQKRSHTCSYLGNVQSTKKRPDGLAFVRMFDHRVLDMCEVGVDSWKSMTEFKVRAHFSQTLGSDRALGRKVKNSVCCMTGW